jgi:hypothetical protein
MPIFKGLSVCWCKYTSQRCKGNSCLIKYTHVAPRLASSLIFTLPSVLPQNIFWHQYIYWGEPQGPAGTKYICVTTTHWWETSHLVNSASSCTIRALCYKGSVFNQRLLAHMQDSNESHRRECLHFFCSTWGAVCVRECHVTLVRCFIPTQVWNYNTLQRRGSKNSPTDHWWITNKKI